MCDSTERTLDRMLWWAGAAALALALTAALTAVWMQLTVEPARRVSRSIIVAPPAVSAAAEDVDDMIRPVHLRRFALNALLAPLIDDAEPGRWTDVALDFMCDDATRVLVDGEPLVPGSPIPTVPFSIRWEMSHCEPLGPVMALSGGVDLFVSHEASSMTAAVVPDRLRIQGSKGLINVDHAFTATLTLKGAPTDP